MAAHSVPRQLGMIEAVVSLVALAIIAWLVTPAMTLATSDVQYTVLAEHVRSVREVVAHHRHSASVRVGRAGWPLAISPEWFASGELPPHPATSEPFVVEVVEGDIDEIAPLDKTFNARDEGAATLWYNRTNGAVCARVAFTSEEDRLLLAFNLANELDLASMAQTHATYPGN